MVKPLDTVEMLAGIDSALGGETPLVTYCEGAVIFSEGDPGSLAYIVEQGEVRISKRIEGEERVIATLGPGELLGEMVFIDQGQRSATATAVVETELVPISRVQLERALSTADPLLQLVLQELTHRLRHGRGAPSTPGSRKARNAVIEDVRVQRDLRTALTRGEMLLHYQPVVEIPSRRILGFEALVRWLHPERGMISPAQFVGVAEASGLIVPVGLWVLKEASHFLKRLRLHAARGLATGTPLFMDVNISPRQLRNPADVSNLVNALAAADLEPGAVKLELTEAALIQDPETAQAAMRTLKTAGAHLAIDDFGTGYSSLSYLHRFPLDVLKIDRSFVNGMLHDENALRIVRAIIGLAEDLELETVAEGIERPEEAHKLVELGCRQAQGYLFSKPVPAADAIAMVRAQGRGQAA